MIKFKPGDRVWLYVVYDSETEEYKHGTMVWQGEGTVRGYVSEMEPADIADVESTNGGDLVVLCDHEINEKPHGRAYKHSEGQGPHVYDEEAYGGYWSTTIIVKV